MLVTKLPSWQAESRMHRMLHNKLLELLHLVEYHRFLSPMWQQFLISQQLIEK